MRVLREHIGIVNYPLLSVVVNRIISGLGASNLLLKGQVYTDLAVQPCTHHHRIRPLLSFVY